MPRRNRELNVFGLSFMDVLANTVGGLAFLLILTVMMIGTRAPDVAPPQITTEVLPDAFAGEPYTAWLAAREGMGKFRWSVREGQLPPGLTLDGETGRLSGTIESSDAIRRDPKVTLEVTCAAVVPEGSAPPSVTQALTFHVRHDAPAEVTPLQIMTEPVLPDAYGGRPYPMALSAQGGAAPYEWKVIAGELPAGLTVNREGRFRGEPSAPGQYRFTVAVEGGRGQTAQQAFTLDVETKYPMPKAPPPLQVVTQGVPKAVATNLYGIFVAAEGGVPPYSWQTAGAPSWLKTYPGQAALFGGRPSIDDIGSRPVVWTVTDSEGNSASSKEIRLEVLPPVLKKAIPLALRTTMLPDGRVGDPYRLFANVQGGVPPYRWEIDQPLSNVGISFTPGDEADGGNHLAELGAFAGTPAVAASEKRTITVIDSAGTRRSQELTLRIRPALTPLQVVTSVAPEGRVNSSYDLALAATGGHSPYSWKQISGELPPGLQLAAGKVTGTPEAVGTWNASFQVADAEGTLAAEPLPLSFQILTAQGNTKLIVKTDHVPTLLRNQSVRLAFACEGGQPPYAWEMIDNAPPQLNFESSFLTGAPSTTGIFHTTFRVRDQEGQTAQVAMPVEIQSMLPAWWAYWLGAALLVAVALMLWLARKAHSRKPLPLTINTQSLPNARASCQYEVQLSCVGGMAPYTWRIREGELPAGLSLSEDGRLTGCPLENISVQETLEFAFEVEVRDSQGHTTSQRL